MSDLIGKMIGQYKIVEEIGIGGMATVFKAFQPSINRYVAIKILPLQFAHDPNFVKRFEQEARAIAALEHPHILPVYDFGTDSGLTYMVMRYVEGGSLADLMGEPMSDERIVQIVGDVARALDYAHSQGVVHRDIKPGNVLIDKHGEVLLTDFGIAKMMQESGGTQLTGTGSILGTPEYMSPEQAEGISVDSRSDIYSLGVVLYELLTGEPPYKAKTPLAIVFKHVNEPLPSPRTIKSGVPIPLEQVVIKAMAKNRDERYQSAAEMEQALKDALAEIERGSPTANIPLKSTKEVSQTTAPTKSKSAMGPILIIGILAILLLCGGAIAIFGLVAVSSNRDATGTAVSGDISVSGDLGGTVESTTEPPPSDPTATPTPGSTGSDKILLPSALDRAVLFQETFDSNDAGWTVDEENDEYGQYIANFNDGRYRMSQSAEKGVFVWEQLPDANFENFVLVVDAIPIEANNSAFGYGLTFHNNDSFTDLYVFEIDESAFWVSKLIDNNWTSLIEYTPVASVNPDGPNQLMVEVLGPAMTFFINGQEVGSVSDNSLQAGSVGMAVEMFEPGQSATVEFDNLTIYALTDEELSTLGDTTILFEEYFDSDINGWSTGEFEDDYSMDEITIEDGQYTLHVTAKQPAFVEKKPPNLAFSDFTLTIDATPYDTAEGYYYGIAFRENSDGHVYTFEIGNDGFYAIFLFDGEWSKLKDWSSSDAINIGGTNTLQVTANDNILTFSVNGQELTTVQDDTLSSGNIGLIVDMFEEGQTATVDFDNLVIRRISTQGVKK